MRCLRIALAVAILGLPAEGLAQEPPRTDGATATTQANGVDATKLGVSLERIRRELRQAEAKEQSGGGGPLKLEFTVEVYGKAPRIDLLENFSVTGPAQYGGPTHREVLEFLTPIEHRSPAFPISAVAFWAAKQLWNRSRKAQCEAELAEYKQLVMQGVSVAAPRCTQ